MPRKEEPTTTLSNQAHGRDRFSSTERHWLHSLPRYRLDWVLRRLRSNMSRSRSRQDTRAGISTNTVVLCSAGAAAASLSWRPHRRRRPPGNDGVPVRDCASLVYPFATDLLRCNRTNENRITIIPEICSCGLILIATEKSD
jgi:hypothetical protein